ncbi:TIM barrel protein [Nonomuraea sp. NPDC046570]|uniref:TIM barrel protein n=1 Tax=Nonomuraea sp. NPDC046570 TaxID=3155255 RepID=UPI0033EA2B0A
MKTAAAPISWGVCEVPGWGVQLDRERVLGEMRELGLTATELGPEGFLPPSPARRKALLDDFGLIAIGGFLPCVLHDPGHDPLPAMRARMRDFAEGDVGVMVLAADSDVEGYDRRPTLDATGWKTLLRNLDRIVSDAAEFGRTVTLHPHVGTMVETAEEVDRVLEGSSVPLCLDTGHLLIGGTDPLDLVKRDPGRIAHVHLKDVTTATAERVRAGELTYTKAVGEGIYRPLGQGDVDIAGIVSALTRHGYTGWYVMEQDVTLTDNDAHPIDDVRRSLAYLDGLS